MAKINSNIKNTAAELKRLIGRRWDEADLQEGEPELKHVETALNIVGLADRSGHKPSELSGGQQQRVAIARALVSDPDILVCDEPTGDLDRDTATDILNLLKSLNEDHGKTILMVTHDPAAAESAKRSLHLDKGKLII